MSNTFSSKQGAVIYVYSEPVRMSCGFPKLTELAKSFIPNPNNGSLFLFSNKKQNYIKILYWYRNGMCLFAKQLPSGIFEIEGKSGKISLDEMKRIVDSVLLPHATQRRTMKLA